MLTLLSIPSLIARGGFIVAVMKMCDILHARHRSLWLRANWIFNLTNLAKQQIKLLGTIHGLTMKVIRNKKNAFKMGTRGSLARTEINTKGFGEGLESFRTTTTTVEGLSFGQSSGLKDDLDVDNEADDVGEKKRLAFLDLLLESAQNGALITDKEIKEQVDTIMFEGHDTTAAASSFFLSLMGIHQDIQEKVVQELHEIFGDSDRPATFQDTLEMKYLERCLMETLRLFPPVPIIARELKENLKLSSGKYTVPAGATVVITTYLLHRDKNIYPNPTKFDPDNFLPERSANRHYYAFVPFSAGPRSCVGKHLNTNTISLFMYTFSALLLPIFRNLHLMYTHTHGEFTECIKLCIGIINDFCMDDLWLVMNSYSISLCLTYHSLIHILILSCVRFVRSLFFHSRS